MKNPSGVWRAAFGYLVLAIIATWPLARQLDSAVPHDLGDPLLVTYLLNWNATITPLTERWWHPPFFWPTRDVMTLSEHMLGLSLVATPLQWLGLSPLATYNVLFIGAFWSAGVGGWLLGWTLTYRRLAAWTAGLVFMLAPYRFSHLPHLQILASFGVPVMFAALHQAIAQADRQTPAQRPRISRVTRWVLAAIACWLWQGLISGYFLAFLAIGLLFWLLWFARERWSIWVNCAIYGSAGAPLVAPILYRYRTVHAAGGYRREMVEVTEFSADVAGLWQVSDRLALWGQLLPKGAIEEQLFPGLATLALAVFAMTTLPRATGAVRRATWILLGVGVLFLVAGAVAFFSPGDIRLLGIPVSLHSPHKPLAIAWLALFAALLSSATFAAAWRSRSPAAGYLVIAIATWILALGPAPVLYGEAVWFRAPYWWLYQYVPGFGEFRVPARLYVITTAALAALAALGADRLLRSGRVGGVALVAVLGLAVVAVGWLGGLPGARAPAPMAIPADASLVIELPAGDAARDAAAMYRTLSHQRPVANGWSGYMPKSMADLMRIDGGDTAPLLDWARSRRIAVIVHRDAPALSRYQDLLKRAGAECVDAETAIICSVGGG